MIHPSKEANDIAEFKQASPLQRLWSIISPILVLNVVPGIIVFFATLIMYDTKFILRIIYSAIVAVILGSILLIFLQRPTLKRIEADIAVRKLNSIPLRSIALIILASFCLNAINCSIQFSGSLGGYGYSFLNVFAASLPELDLLGAQGLHPLVVLALLTHIVILAPIIEENCFRGIIFPRLRYWIGVPAALLLQALLFALIHGNLPQAILAMPLGCFAAWCLLRFGNLKLAILSHAVVNATGSFFGVVAARVSWNRLMPLILIVTVPLFVLSLFLLRREAVRLPKLLMREFNPAACKDSVSGTDSSSLSDRGTPLLSRYAANTYAMPFPLTEKIPVKTEPAYLNFSRKLKRLNT